MQIFYISDTHFGHTNIIEYTRRPFKSTNEMDETMVNNWNRVVGIGDLVIHGGDVALANMNYATHLVKSLNGDKVLVRGNHDGSVSKMRRMGFVDVISYWWSALTGVLVWHDPNDIPPHMEMLTSVATHILYGHLHEKIYTKPNFYSICVEQIGYTPRTLEEILQIKPIP